jgi:hypothetical protein
MRLAVLTGFEPATSALTGRRALHCSTEPGDSEAGLLPSVPTTDLAFDATVAVINHANAMGGSVVSAGSQINFTVFRNKLQTMHGGYSSHDISFLYGHSLAEGSDIPRSEKSAKRTF